MFFRSMVGFVVCLGLVASASAEVLPPSIDIGSHTIAGNSTAEMIQIFVTGAQDVTGLQLYAQIGDGWHDVANGTGAGVEPIFAGIMWSGALWGNKSGSTGGSQGNPPYSTMGLYNYGSVIEQGITFDPVPDPEFPATEYDEDYYKTLDGTPRLVATLAINTMGYSSGTFDLMFDAPSIGTGGDSYFLDTSGDPVFPTITQGSITIIPEPATLSLLALGGLAFLRRRSR